MGERKSEGEREGVGGGKVRESDKEKREGKGEGAGIVKEERERVYKVEGKKEGRMWIAMKMPTRWPGGFHFRET